MRRPAFVLLLLSAPPAAVAVGREAPACRLSPAECAVVLREVAVDADLFAQDAEILGFGLSPSDRARALIRRDAERMDERFRHLPAPVADEVRRLQACGASDGAEDAAPLCR